jgi:hypothetical protein
MREYDAYLPVIFNRQWMRPYVFAGLSDVCTNARYFQIVKQRILTSLAWRCGEEFVVGA